MQKILSLPWWAQALFGSFFIVPIMVIPGYLKRMHEVAPAVTACYYYVGLIIGVSVVATKGGVNSPQDFIPSWPVLIAVIAGTFCGGPGYLAFYNSMAIAPNAGIASAIFSANAIWAMGLLVVLGQYFPRVFPQQGLSWYNYAGVFVVIVGVVMAGFRSPPAVGSP